MEKLNIAELLKDCPKGMELDCTIYDSVYFDGINNSKTFPINIGINTVGTWCSKITLDKYGRPNSHPNSKCVIFPKGKTTWDGFIPPCLFNDGDILTYMFYNKPTIYIYRKNGGYNTSYYAAYSSENKKFYNIQTGALSGNRNDLRFATEEEKHKLFDVIKAHGYKWNPETKTLEKLIEPKFKVGNKIKHCSIETNNTYTIVSIEGLKYLIKDNEEHIYEIKIKSQDDWELAPNKFDITTLKPFDKVLVRLRDTDHWKPAFWGKRIQNHNFPFITSYGYTAQAIPFKGNEWIVGTTEDCSDYYKTWK